MLPDYEGCLRLLSAIVRQWLKEAKGNSEELAAVADWLGMTLPELQKRIEGDNQAARASAFYRVCPGCGRALPEHNAGASGAGRLRLYCDDRCRRRADTMRRKERNHAVV